MKKISLFLVLVLCLVAGLMTLSSCEDKGDKWINNASIEAVLSEQGTLDVSERWDVGTSDSEGYRNFYRTIQVRDYKFGTTTSKLTLVSVYNNTAKKEYPVTEEITSMSDSVYEKNVTKYKERSYCIKTASDTYEIGIILPTALRSGETVSFTFRYRMEDFAGAYADIAEFDWKPYSSDFEMYISRLDIKITMPERVDYADVNNTYAWLHCTAESNIELNGNIITATAEKVSAGTDVGIHSLVPVSCFGELTKTSSQNKKAALIAQEDKWQNEYLKELKKQAILGIVDIVGSIFIVVLSIVFTVLSHIFGKYRNKDKIYLREIPPDWTAAEMGEFFYWYRGGAQKHSGALLSATMLDLARRDYIDILPDAKQEYLIDIKEVPQAQKEDMRAFEKELIELLAEVQKKNGGQPFSMKKFEEFSKNNITFVNRHMTKFLSYATVKFKQGKYVGQKRLTQSIGTGLGALFFFMGILTYLFLSRYFAYLVPAGILSGLVLMLGIYKIPPLNKEGNKIHADTIALRDYMLDFSNLKEYDVPQLMLWEEYLVYATMMGISEKVVKKLKLVYKELQEARYEDSYYRRGYIYTYFYLCSRPHYASGAKMFDLGTHMQTAIRNANAFTRAQQVSNAARNNIGGFGGGGHGGGGFSGGGGFGGGGGGGRH